MMEGLQHLAEVDARLARENGVDLNPFSTLGVRYLWQQGWDGLHPPNLIEGSYNWRAWERGRLAREIHERDKA